MPGKDLKQYNSLHQMKMLAWFFVSNVNLLIAIILCFCVNKYWCLKTGGTNYGRTHCKKTFIFRKPEPKSFLFSQKKVSHPKQNLDFSQFRQKRDFIEKSSTD